MLCQQYINEFNQYASSVKFLTSTEELVLSSKLKRIQSHFIDEVPGCELTLFFSNLYHLLCQSSNMKSELLDNCLDILLTCINSENEKIRNSLLSDFRFLSTISNLLPAQDNDDEKLIKTLAVIKELINFSSEMNEHNLKLITEALGDYTNSSNEEVKSLCFQILANLCLDNDAAKYLISRKMKTTKLRENVTQLPNNLVSFKFYLMMEDEVQAKDFKYFMTFAIEALHESIELYQIDGARHALDIVKHWKKKELQIDFHITDDTEILEKMSKLTSELIDKLSDPAITPAMRKFYDNTYQLFGELITVNAKLVEPLEQFVELVFTTAALCRSKQAINFLSAFVQNDGILKSSEIIIESLLNFFGEAQEDMSDNQKCALLQLLSILDMKNKLSDLHLAAVSGYLNQIFKVFNACSLSSLSDNDCCTFVYFLSSLRVLAKNHQPMFYGLLTDALRIDFLPLLVVRAHLMRNEEILVMLFQLASIPNYPNQKIASMLAKSGTRAEGNMTQSVLNSLERRAIHSNNMKVFNARLNDDLELLIEKVNAKIDSNDFEKNTADIVQLYRHKVSALTDQLSSVTSALERNTAEVGELQQKYTSFMKISEKQEFANWCLQLDNDRLKQELREVEANNNRFKKCLSDFQVIIDKAESDKLEAKKVLKLKLKEVTRLVEEKEQIGMKLQETKSRLQVMQQENESRIIELKDSLEKEKQKKEEELISAEAEQKKINQKLVNAEKEKQKLQEIIKLNEKEIIQLRDKCQAYEVELKDCEQMKSTIMNLMQTRSFKK